MNHNWPVWFPPGITIVTSTARLARRLSWLYTQSQLAAGAAAWETPDIVPWSQWIARLWAARQRDGARRQSVLSTAQCRLVWHQIVDAPAWRGHLLQPAAVALRAMDAWDTLQAWDVPVFPDDVFLNEDARAFLAWTEAYRRRCSDDDWIDAASLPAMLAQDRDALSRSPRQPVSLVGFDEIAPASRNLLAALARSGVDVTQRAAARASGHVVRTACDDSRAELTTAARWARHCLEQDPASSIGIVVPGLASARARVHEILSDVLTPASLLSVPDGRQGVFSIAAGEPLAAQPLVAHGLLILALAAEPLAAMEISALLRSPFLRGAAAEAPGRAVLDAVLRRRREPELGLGAILAGGDSDAFRGAPMLRHCLDALQQCVRRLPSRQRAPQWARACSELLKMAGWPGDRTLTSVEFQVLQAWRETLAELATLDAVSGNLGFAAALRHLRRLAADRSFQPQSPEAPVQVLDLAGAADMAFDHLWVTGLHEDVWPPAARPNPFIPLPLQRERGMPRASAELELARARRMTGALLKCCTDVVVSWPRQDADTVLRPSPLIRDVAEGVPPQAPESHWIGVVFAARRTESFVDDAGPPLATAAEVHGGASLFRNQAACPFRAFARHRLRAEALDEADVGLDAMDRGNLVHDVLQRVWRSLGDHDALTRLSQSQRDALIAGVVDQAVSAAASRRPRVFTTRFAAVERDRLCALIGEWLNVERDRTPFTVIGCETSQPFRLGGIAGEVRMDRIDALPDGRRVILDYKTGRVPSNPWEGARPEEPQLPLYAVTGAEPLAAVAFARIARGDSGFKGAAVEKDILPAVRTVAAWDGLIEDWRGTLLALARGFERGHAPVDPRDSAVCDHCDLHSFCRVQELGVAPEGDDDHGE
jgi:probable DNA repair protein